MPWVKHIDVWFQWASIWQRTSTIINAHRRFYLFVNSVCWSVGFAMFRVMALGFAFHAFCSQLRCIYGFLSTYNFFLDNLKIWWIKLCLYINYFLSTALLAILPDSHWSIRRSRDHTADCLYKVHKYWYTGRRTSRGYTLGEHKINFINMNYRLSITITSQKVCKLLLLSWCTFEELLSAVRWKMTMTFYG